LLDSYWRGASGRHIVPRGPSPAKPPDGVLREAAALAVICLSGEEPTHENHDLEIDGYGVWSGLRIEVLRRHQRAVRPNEAGKTTLLQFIRSMLYGSRIAAAVSAAAARRTPRGALEWPVRRAASKSAATMIRRRWHAGRATHPHRPDGTARAALHQGAGGQRRRARVQQCLCRRPARDSRAATLSDNRSRRTALQLSAGWIAFRW